MGSPHPGIDILVEVIGYAVSASASQYDRYQGEQKHIPGSAALPGNYRGANPDESQQTRLTRFQQGHIVDDSLALRFPSYFACKCSLRNFSSLSHVWYSPRAFVYTLL
jgi:hypothetical protein